MRESLSGTTWDEWAGSQDQEEEWASFLKRSGLSDCQDSKLLEKLYQAWRSGSNAGWYAGREVLRDDNIKQALRQTLNDYHEDMMSAIRRWNKESRQEKDQSQASKYKNDLSPGVVSDWLNNKD
jgi:hypothetical protein